MNGREDYDMRDIPNVEEYCNNACRLDKFAITYVVCKRGMAELK